MTVEEKKTLFLFSLLFESESVRRYPIFHEVASLRYGDTICKGLCLGFEMKLSIFHSTYLLYKSSSRKRAIKYNKQCHRQ
jgi:hypothetical protein